VSRKLALGEFALIARYFAPLAKDDPNTFGLTDDAAVVPARPGCDLVATQDAIIAGVHFLPGDPPDTIAKKLLRVNLSDLAAKGAEPHGYLMACAFPEDITEDWLSAFARGLGEDQARYGIHLLGGDTDRTPGPLMLSVTALGFVPAGGMIRRAGARPGDSIFVSGAIGDAALGLDVIRGRRKVSPEAAAAFVTRYRLPEPRVALGQRLRGLAHAAIDVSDGLVADLGHIAECSGVRAVLDLRLLPLSEPAASLVRKEPELVRSLATGGDDYELLICAPAQSQAALHAAASETGVRLTSIGRIDTGRGVSVLGLDGKPLKLEQTGFRHF
jgi:thiamine-monophosphate kinase